MVLQVPNNVHKSCLRSSTRTSAIKTMRNIGTGSQYCLERIFYTSVQHNIARKIIPMHVVEEPEKIFTTDPHTRSNRITMISSISTTNRYQRQERKHQLLQLCHCRFCCRHHCHRLCCRCHHRRCRRHCRRCSIFEKQTSGRCRT